MKAIQGLLEGELGVLVVLAAGLAAAALVTTLPDRASGRTPAPSSKFVPAPPGPSITLRGVAEAGAGALSLDEFLGLLSTAAPAPLAEKFTKVALKSKPLREEWARFTREEGRKAPARDFLRRVARMPEFRRLMNQLRGEPGFHGAFQRLSADPSVRAVLREAVARAPGLTTAPKAARAASAQARLDAPARESAAFSGKRPVSSAVPGGGSAASDRTSGAPAAVVAAPGGAPGSDRGSLGNDPERPASEDGRSIARGGEDAGGLTSLRALYVAGESKEAGSFLDSLFATAPKALRDALLYQCEVNDICEPFAACMAAGMYEECVAACAENPACGGSGILPAAAQAVESISGGPATDGVGAGKPKLLRKEDDGIGNALTDASASQDAACAVPGAGDRASGWEALGGFLGGVAGGLIGGAIGGPAGAVAGGSIGATLGAEAGGMIDGALDALAGLVS